MCLPRLGMSLCSVAVEYGFCIRNHSRTEFSTSLLLYNMRLPKCCYSDTDSTLQDPEIPNEKDCSNACALFGVALS
jgi:hypothetical protein